MKILSTIFLFFSLCLYGQKSPERSLPKTNVFFQHSSFSYINPVATEAERIAMIKSFGLLPEGIELQLNYKVESKILEHYHYKVLKNGIELYLADVHIAIDAQNKVQLCEIPNTPFSFSNENLNVTSVAKNLQINRGAERIIDSKEVWYYDQSDLLKKGILVELAGPETLHEEILYANSKIVNHSDLLRYHTGPNDTTVSVKVFSPDPLSTARVSYGGNYVDSNDQNYPLIESQQKVDSIVATYSNGSFRALNDYVKISDFSAPVIAPITSLTPEMQYTRDQAGFEDMNVLYHITKHKLHLINLGYPNLPSYRIDIDPHALNGADQSFFTTSANPPRLYFGEGGVDDAEDADVIIHEYTHAIIHSASPSTTTSTERGCIEEAIGDYFAAAYSLEINNNYNHQNFVFNWDGHNDFWAGRKVGSNKDYKLQSFAGGIYTHTDLFASVLMDINGKLGRNACDEILIEALFNLSSNTTMPEFALYMISIDNQLNGGINKKTIREAFAKRNILPGFDIGEYNTEPLGIKVYNTYAFASGGDLMVESINEYINAYTLYNVNGQVIAESNLEINPSDKMALSFENLSSGIYLLELKNKHGKTAVYKLSRY